MGGPGGLGDLDGQVDQKAQACLVGPLLHYLPSAPACLVFLVFPWVPCVLLSQAHPLDPFHLSAPTFQEIPGNPVKRATHIVTASEIVLERAVEECGQLFSR